MATGGTINLGVIGLGRGLMLALPALIAHPSIRLVAAADPRPDARERFAAEFGARAYADWAELLADPAIDAVYIAAPHQFHAEQAVAAARAGKHVLVEKPKLGRQQIRLSQYEPSPAVQVEGGCDRHNSGHRQSDHGGRESLLLRNVERIQPPRFW